MKPLLTLLLLLSAAAFADDGCGIWAHPEPTDVISCDWYNIDGQGWQYICLNQWQCVNDTCESITRPGESKEKGTEAESAAADADRKRK